MTEIFTENEAAETFMVGNRRRLRATFVDSNSAPANPTTVTCSVRKPDDTVDVYTGGQLTNTPVGTFFVDVTLDMAGLWHFRFEGTGSIVQAREKRFVVDHSSVI